MQLSKKADAKAREILEGYHRQTTDRTKEDVNIYLRHAMKAVLQIDGNRYSEEMLKVYLNNMWLDIEETAAKTAGWKNLEEGTKRAERKDRKSKAVETAERVIARTEIYLKGLEPAPQLDTGLARKIITADSGVWDAFGCNGRAIDNNLSEGCRIDIGKLQDAGLVRMRVMEYDGGSWRIIYYEPTGRVPKETKPRGGMEEMYEEAWAVVDRERKKQT